jgi:hypothetical protein
MRLGVAITVVVMSVFGIVFALEGIYVFLIPLGLARIDDEECASV